MFGFGKSYDDEYLELNEYLTQQWGMNPEFAKPFLDSYKKNIGKKLSEGRKRMEMLENSPDPGVRLMRYANVGHEYDFALVGQAYQAYLVDLRHGRHVGTPVEKTIWAILAKRSDLVETHDRAFAKWIENKHEEKFPGLFEEVFQFDE